MNLGGLANGAANAAGNAAAKGAASAATNTATNAASNAATNVANSQASNIASSSLPKSASPSNGIGVNQSNPMGQESITDLSSGNNTPLDNLADTGNAGDFTELPQDQLGESLDEGGNDSFPPEEQQSGQESSEGGNPENGGEQGGENGAQPGDKVDAGKEINEKGEVDDTATKKTVKAVGRGVAAYFTGGQSLGADQAITNNEVGDKLIGVVSDVMEKSPGVKQAAEALDELGLPDVANDVMDVAGDIKNGDIGSAIQHGEKALKSVDESKKKISKKIFSIIIGAAAGFAFFLLILISVLGPVIGGVMNITDKISDVFSYVGNAITEHFANWEYAMIDSISYQAMLDSVPDYNKLSDFRQDILATAFTLVGTPYNWGGKASGPGLENVPASGLDCSGFVQWVYWTVLGENPGFSYTGHFINGHHRLVQIEKHEMKPGDICLPKDPISAGSQNHVVIYTGNGYAVHAAGTAVGVIHGSYDNCTIFFRHELAD